MKKKCNFGRETYCREENHCFCPINPLPITVYFLNFLNNTIISTGKIPSVNNFFSYKNTCIKLYNDFSLDYINYFGYKEVITNPHEYFIYLIKEDDWVEFLSKQKESISYDNNLIDFLYKE